MKQLFKISKIAFHGLWSAWVLLGFSFCAQAQCPTLVWSDEFNGSTLNTADWNYETGPATVNNEDENYTSRSNNLVVSGGTLKIIALSEVLGGKNYTSAKINTSGKHHFKYGRMEASIKLPKTQGLWPAFWMMPQNSVNGGWPQSGEIDIMEEQGANPFKDFGTIHYGTDAGAGHKSSGGTTTSSSDLSAGFHTYAVEWKPDTINWFLDNVNYYTITKTGISPSYWPFNDDDFFFILNVAVGGWFGGNADGTSVFPQTMEVDYVRVYSNPQTLVIDGRGKAFAGSDQKYTIKNGVASSYNWLVPGGATVTAGQGTNSATVHWGNTGGTVTLDAVIDTCGHYFFNKPVTVYKDSCYFAFEDFETHRILNNTGYTGTAYNPASANPNTSNTVNTSSTVGYYKRNTPVQYDVFQYEAELLSDVTQYENKNKVFSMDVYTSAPVGTTVNLQLEDKNKTSGAYPLGRRSIFWTQTTKQYQWETLKFLSSTVPAGSGSTVNDVNQITFLFNPNSYTSDYYYIDNFRSEDKLGCPVVTSIQSSYAQEDLILSPNPASSEFFVQNNLNNASEMNYSITDILGKEVLSGKLTGSGQAITIINLVPGVYFVNFMQGTERRVRKLVVE
ncbi:MAG: family 16 glycosylhydrolase [Cytophagaceae bacterium]